jgi:lipoprotein-anchoring transpeptidase ErfK/SrfK
MSRPVLLIVLVAALGAAGMAAAFAATSRARSRHAAQARPAATAAPAPAVAQAPPLTPVRTAPAPAASFRTAAVEAGRTVALRARPGGRVQAHVGGTTEFGSRTVLSVAASRGGWLGVTSTALPNGTVGWVKSQSGLDVRRTRISIRVDLSKRRLELRRGDRVVRAVRVAIGRPGSSTPLGRFSITDKLSGSRYGAYYGCCILALSGHQPHTPAGWQGGDRLAIHGTDSPGTIGTPASAGCLRAADQDLRVLMRQVPLGTPVFIRS